MPDPIVSKLPPAPPCHIGNVLVFEAHRIKVYAGGDTRYAAPEDVDVVLDLADILRQWKFPKGWKAEGHAVPIVLGMYIPDFDAPRVHPDFYRDLWDDLVVEAIGRPDPLKVLIMCQGGHGRTGTVLTCLAIAAGVVPKSEDPVLWMRSRYCWQAVEAAVQINHIERVAGRPIVAKPVWYSKYSSAKTTAITPVKEEPTTKDDPEPLELEDDDDLEPLIDENGNCLWCGHHEDDCVCFGAYV